jgi:hypothetical protein
MDESFRSKLEARLADYREFSCRRRLDGCRLVQYCGVERVGAVDIVKTQVEPQIAELLCEGFFVDWAESDGRAYLRVWEVDGPEPPWPKVFAEGHLADIDALRRDAGGTA